MQSRPNHLPTGSLENSSLNPDPVNLSAEQIAEAIRQEELQRQRAEERNAILQGPYAHTLCPSLPLRIRQSSSMMRDSLPSRLNNLNTLFNAMLSSSDSDTDMEIDTDEVGLATSSSPAKLGPK